MNDNMQINYLTTFLLRESPMNSSGLSKCWSLVKLTIANSCNPQQHQSLSTTTSTTPLSIILWLVAQAVSTSAANFDTKWGNAEHCQYNFCTLIFKNELMAYKSFGTEKANATFFFFSNVSLKGSQITLLYCKCRTFPYMVMKKEKNCIFWSLILTLI